jgi:hypothetical protein
MADRDERVDALVTARLGDKRDRVRSLQPAFRTRSRRRRSSYSVLPMQRRVDGRSMDLHTNNRLQYRSSEPQAHTPTGTRRQSIQRPVATSTPTRIQIHASRRSSRAPRARRDRPLVAAASALTLHNRLTSIDFWIDADLGGGRRLSSQRPTVCQSGVQRALAVDSWFRPPRARPLHTRLSIRSNGRLAGTQPDYDDSASRAMPPRVASSAPSLSVNPQMTS